MALGVSRIEVQREVTVVSSGCGPPRLELASSTTKSGRFSSFGVDGDISIEPRTKSSTDLLNDIFRRESMRDDLPEKPRGRARDEGDRPGLNDLITFLRNVSPPPQNYMSSAFDEAEPGSDQSKWMLLKKLRRKRTRSDSPARRSKTKLPDSAVAAYTTGGHAHIAISIPLEHCHLGPEENVQLAVYNATPPLPPSPPLTADEIETTGGPVKTYTTERVVTVLKTVNEDRESLSSGSRKGSTSQAPSNRPSATVSLWPHTAPISPPRSPATPPSEGSPRKAPRTPVYTGTSLPMNPDDYNGIPNTSPPAPKTPEDVLEARRQKAYLTWMTTTGVLQSAPGPPRHSTGKRPEKRPEMLNLPARNSSSQIVSSSHSQPHSIDGLIGGQSRHLRKISDVPQPSPTAFSEQSIADSVATNGTEPVVENARSVRGYSNIPIITQTPSATPRHSVLLGPNEPPAMVSASDFVVASRKNSIKTTSSRLDRVRELRQRDLEKARAKKQQQQETDNLAIDRPETSDSTASTRLQDSTLACTDLQPGVDILENSTKPQDTAGQGEASTQDRKGVEATTAPLRPPPPAPVDNKATPPGARSSLLSGRVQKLQELADSQPQIPNSADEAILLPHGSDDIARESMISSEAPRRFGSYHRTSWASSIPLLDRLSSYSPSDGRNTQLLGSADGEPMDVPEMSADSASHSREDSSHLIPSRLFSSESDPSSSTVDRNDTRVVSNQFSLSHLTDIMPVVEIQPYTPPEERWSGATLSTPITALRVSPTIPAPQATPRPHSTEPAPLRSQRRTAPNDLSLPLDRTSLARRREWNAERDRERRAQGLNDASSPRFTSFVPEVRRSHALLRMSTRELLNHYETLRGERMTDLAHNMLERQQMLEICVRRQERNTAVFHQILERILDIVDHRLPATPYLHGHLMSEWTNGNLSGSQEDMRGGRFELRTLRRTGRLPNDVQVQPPRPSRRIIESSEDSDSLRDWRAVEAPERRRRRQHVVGATGLEGLEPVMRELQGASRLSLESPRDRDTSLDEDPESYINMF